ncbi:MAG: DUF4330 family protein [Clostridia bacterium]|nr:DUF4330 family protein [Clostridia bacterium]
MNLNTKKKKSINFVDLIIIIALISALILAGTVIFRDVAGGDRVTVSYTVKVEPIDTTFVSKAAEGNGVYDFETAEFIGTVSAVSDAQAYKRSYREDGTVKDSVIEGMSVLYITVEAEAIRRDNGYAIGSTLVGIGRELEIRLPNLYCSGECVRVEVIEE